jgi:GT2 family glycosyltransferase
MTLDTNAVELDVVVPTRDRPAQLSACLRALERQSVERFGVIVVDDGSKTAAELQLPDAVRDALAIRFVRNETSIGPGPSRNRGVGESNAPYVVFLDDDCIPDPDLIGRHLKALASAAGPIVSLGPILPPPGQRFPVWTHWDADRWEQEYRRLNSGQTRPGWGNLFSGNVGLRRADFLAVGGFDERLARQEDIELGFRLDRFGCRFELDPAAVVWHDSQRSLRSWMRMPAVSACFDVEFDRRVPDSGRLSAVHKRLGRSHWALRLTRRTVRAPLARRFVIVCAVGGGCLLHALRADRAALAAFSLVWDLTYCEALRAAMSTAPR